MSSKTVVKKILSFIESNLDENLTLENISKELNYSKFYVARIFREHTGCTMYKYIQSRRLTEAARMLVETDKPIIEIAFEAKYNSQQAFSQAFHQVYLCTPQGFRKNNIFYPKQTGITMKANRNCFSHTDQVLGGKMAA